MKQFERKMSKFCLSIYITCSSLIILLTVVSRFAQSDQITSQYIGTQSNGNDHVLLFKLPQSISSQLQNQLPRRSNAEINLIANRLEVNNNNNGAQYSGPRHQQSYRLLRQVQPEHQTGEQSIPLIFPQQTSNQFKSNEQQINRAVQNHQLDGGNYAHERNPVAIKSLYDYSTTHELALLQQQRQLEDLLELERQQQQQLKHLQQEKAQLDKEIHINNLDSIVEQKVRQFLAQQQQLASQYASSPTPQHVTATIPPSYLHESQPQPTLWRDSQLNPNGPNYVENAASTNSSGLLSKLASSSPELLMRLKSLLSQAASGSSSQQQQPTRFSGNNAETNYTLSEPIKTLHYNYSSGGPVDQNGSGTNYMDQPQQAHLSTNHTNYGINHNATLQQSEIKIPLVVIAMPRILSLKKNLANIGSADQQQASNYTLPHLIGGSMMELNANGNNSSTFGANYFSQLSNGPANYSSSGHLANSSNLSPILLGKQLSIGGSNYSEHVDTTTSLPQHTMAPYAQQFNVPVASPIARHLTNNNNYQSHQVFLYPGQVKVNQPELIYETNMTDSSVRQTMRPAQSMDSLSERPINHQQNRVELDNVFQVQGGYPASQDGSRRIAQYLRMPQPSQQFESQQRTPEQSVYYSSNSNNQMHYVEPAALGQQQQQQYQKHLFIPFNALQQIYSARQANLSLPQQQPQLEVLQNQQSDTTEHQRVLSGANQPGLYLSTQSDNNIPTGGRPTQISGINLIQTPSAAALVEAAGLTKLRPIFRRFQQTAAPDSSQADLPSENRLTNGQLLSLFAGSNADRRNFHGANDNVGNRFGDQIMLNSRRNAQLARRAAAKMVVMIV